MSDDELQLRAQGRVGTVLGGKYHIDSVLGVGGMAVVFAATHRNQRRVAIKMLHPGISMHREARDRFLREGYAANTVDHPGAVAVLDDDTAEDGSGYLVMERLEGDEVERLCQRREGRLPVDAVLAIADALLDVLQAAHAKSIIHRDIKPANLYIQRDGTLKVLDFGIARVRDVASGNASATKTGVMLGTPAYMSPEQALSRSSEIDGRSDLWSVGATLFTLLSGTFVHDGATLTEVIVQAATQPARPLAVALPGVDPRVAAIVDRALSFDKAGRWPDAASMRAAVRSAHLDIYGTRVGREVLEQLFTEGAGTASTVYASATPVPRVLTPAPGSGPGGSQPGIAPPALGPSTPPPFASSAPPFVPPAPGAPVAAYPPPPPVSDPRAISAPPVAVSQVPWPASGYPAPSAGIPVGPMGPPPAPAVTGNGDWTGARRSSSMPAAMIVGITVLACTVCGGIGLLAWSGAKARTPAGPGPTVETAEPVATVVANAPPPVATATATATEEPSVEASAAPPRAPAITPAPLVPVAPARPSAVVTVARPAPTPVYTPPAPTPMPAHTAPTPVYTPPPAPCKSQCVDTARACKSRCKAAYRIGHDRHQCLVSCETTEKECRGRAPC